MNRAPIRVLLVDDHGLVRAGIHALLDAIEGVIVVGEAGSGAEALALMGEARPDIVLTDIAMQAMTGLELASRLRASAPATRVVVLSMHDDPNYVQEALKAGAAGYLLKDAATAELELALRAVSAGGSYLSPAISRKVMEGYAKQLAALPSAVETLTARQREILRLFALGRSTKEIGFQLKISVKTVETHRTQIMRRLEIHDLAGLVRFAVRIGLVSADA